MEVDSVTQDDVGPESLSKDDNNVSVLIKQGLHTLGRHPLTRRHTYLGLNLAQTGITTENISSIAAYTNIMYLDVSYNPQVTSLSALSPLAMLVQLTATNNSLIKCLDFSPPRCTSSQAWSSGGQAVGSMLTLVDLSCNHIAAIDDLSHHPFLETLLLSQNRLTQISGLNTLQYLQVLDLSYNSLSRIEGLDGLNLQELNLEGNHITSLDGLNNLPRLSVLNISSNKIANLAPLQTCSTLVKVDVQHNKIVNIRQTEFLSGLKWLAHLSLHGNPCCNKTHYRSRVIFRLQTLRQLDLTLVSSEEKIRALNLYGSEGGDLRAREEIFHKYFPNEPFNQFSRIFDDEESYIPMNDLLREMYDIEAEERALRRHQASVVANDIVKQVIQSVLILPVNSDDVY